MTEPTDPNPTAPGRRFRPLHGVLAFGLLFAAVLAAQFVWEGGLTRPKYQRSPAPVSGQVTIELADLARSQVRFFRYINPGNQEVRFLVARDSDGVVQVAFDASENDFKMKRGFRQDGDWIVNNKCDTSCRLSEINQGGGCRPIPLRHRLDGERLVLAENDILEGWRYFR